MTEERHHATIRDYVLVFKRRKWVIIGVAIVAALAAGALSVTQAKVYTAQASLEAQSPAQSAGYADLLQANTQLPSETSAQLEQTATRSAVLSRVKSELGLKDSLDQIRSRISISTDAQSNFVLMDGTGSTPEQAAALTNSAANAVVDLSNSDIRRQFAGIANGENREAASLLRPFTGKKFNALTPAEQAKFQTNSQEATGLEAIAARLQAFSKVVTVAQVTSPAGLPSSPSGPHPASNIILGGVLGLLLGVIAAWFLETLDRRLRRPDETESLLGFPTVGVVPAGGLGRSPSEEGTTGTNVSSFRMLRTNVHFLAADRSHAPEVVLVTSALSEEGKTTVATGLACASAASGLRTLLIEADVHRPVHAQRLGLKKGPGLAEYLRDGLEPAEVLQVHTFTDPAQAPIKNGTVNGGGSKLTCITAGDVAGFSGDALGSRRFAEAIDQVRQVYDFVVIDSAPLLAVAETAEMISFVDAVVFCVRLGKTTAEQARSARAALARLPERLTGLVLTDLPPQVGGYYGYGYVYDYADANHHDAKDKRLKEPDIEEPTAV